MPYARSLARQDFLRGTQHILQVTRQATLKKTGLPTTVTDMLFQAVIFKACAQLEEYLKDVISDWLFNAAKRKCFASSLPEDLRWFCVSQAHLAHYRQFMNTPDELRLVDALKGKVQNRLLDDQAPIDGTLFPQSVVGDRKYPSTKNIRTLFNRIGLRNVLDLVNKRTRRNCVLMLESFLSVREAIAHQDPPALTYADVRTHTRNVQRFVDAVDHILYSHVIFHHGCDCWRTT